MYYHPCPIIDVTLSVWNVYRNETVMGQAMIQIQESKTKKKLFQNIFEFSFTICSTKHEITIG